MAERLTPAEAAPLVLGGILIGFSLGSMVTQWRLKTKYERLAEKEIADMRVYYSHQQKAFEARTKAPITEVMEYLGYVKAEGTEEEKAAVEELMAPPPPEVKNVFDNAVEIEWDWEAEKLLRESRPGLPFVIHLDEFGEDGMDTTCYTYYEDDGVIADERDEAIDDVDALLGLNNLERWGHGSGNADVVMIRSPRLDLDIEVCKAKGSYAEDVHGFLSHQYDVERIPKKQPFDDDA